MTGKSLAIAAASIVLAAGCTTSAESTRHLERFDRMGAYIAVDDVDRAEGFYTDILATPPELKLPGFLAYPVGGGMLAVISRAQFAPDSAPGTGVAPYIRTPDMPGLVDALNAAQPDAIVEGPLSEPGITILKVHDPEGNLIEFYALP